MDDNVMTVPEVARYLKLSKSKVYCLVQQRQIPHIKIGRNVRVREKDVQAWLAANSVNVSKQ
ncbi:MAG: helix-turn-helix domain-containing protein [Anaerolineales bacterium]|nr:helix-turn-helix domain-containing protein [Anaerolineales bacterium]